MDEEISVRAFVRNAEEILETPWRVEDRGASEYLIAVSQTECIRVISETAARQAASTEAA